MSLFDGMGDVQPGGRGQGMAAGFDGEVELLEIKLSDARTGGGSKFTAVFKVVTSNSPADPVNATREFFVLVKPDYLETYLANIKACLVAFDPDTPPHEVTGEYLRAAASADNPLCERRAHLTTIDHTTKINKKQIVLYNWSRSHGDALPAPADDGEGSESTPF